MILGLFNIIFKNSIGLAMALKNNNEESTGLIKLAKVTLWTILTVGSVLILKFFGNLIKPLVVALGIYHFRF